MIKLTDLFYHFKRIQTQHNGQTKSNLCSLSFCIPVYYLANFLLVQMIKHAKKELNRQTEKATEQRNVSLLVLSLLKKGRLLTNTGAPFLHRPVIIYKRPKRGAFFLYSNLLSHFSITFCRIDSLLGP